jgi:glycosyltransferase involved in cell wall biosynthesis
VNNSNPIVTGPKLYHLHIVCLDVPYPVDYGGVFDLFYKIKTLSETGILIHLHCFEYGRGQQPALNQYCAEVTYYKRTTGIRGLSLTVPYIVSSRANKNLLKRLQQDDYPILMEGMHCTYFLATGKLPGSRCFVRLHNVEFQYYRQLANTSNAIFKKIYFSWESRLLKKYEKALADKANFWTVTSKDLEVFVKQFGYSSIDYLPLYLPEYHPQWAGEKSNYCLYHGNLSVPENEQAAVWLLTNVFHETKIPFVIAGKNPSEKLKKCAHQYENSCIVCNPGEQEMQDLIRKAQVNILPSLNETGIKLKLINALYNGRHCLVNTAGVDGSGLNGCCVIADSEKDMQVELVRLFDKPFTEEAFYDRIHQLGSIFNNAANARQMISWIFKGEPSVPGKAVQKMSNNT